MAFTDSSYGLFQGQFFLQERAFNGANITGFEFVGDVDMFTINPKLKHVDIEESQSGLGLTSAHILIGTEVDIKFRALDIKMSNWIRATWGGAVAQAAGSTVTGESITLYNGQTTKLAHMGVSALTLSGVVLGVDYTLNSVHGSVTVLPGSTVVPAGTPFVSTAAYTYAASNGRVEAFVTGQRYYRAMLEGRNVAQGNQPVRVICKQWAPDMAKALALIDKKRIELDMDGKLLQDTSIALPIVNTDLSQFFSIEKG